MLLDKIKLTEILISDSTETSEQGFIVDIFVPSSRR